MNARPFLRPDEKPPEKPPVMPSMPTCILTGIPPRRTSKPRPLVIGLTRTGG